MKKVKRDEIKKTTSVCGFLGRCCLIAVSICLLWALLYMPLKVDTSFNIQSSLSFMITQKDLYPFILPENNTNLIVPEFKHNGTLQVLVIVCSAVPNFQSRQAIRDSWAQDTKVLKDVQVIFLLGVTTNSTLSDAVIQESEQHQDILQEDFLDTYNNLTIKSVMLLKWVNLNCMNAKYIMKTDDDMFVNLPNLSKLLQKKGHQKLLMGSLIKGAVPIKNWRSKWYVPEEAYPERVYPPYLSGTGYVMSIDAVPILFHTAINTPFLYLEDIFITGVCAQRAGLTPQNENGFKFYKRKSDTCIFRNLVTAHRMSPNELHIMWKKIHTPSIKCKS